MSDKKKQLEKKEKPNPNPIQRPLKENPSNSKRETPSLRHRDRLLRKCAEPEDMPGLSAVLFVKIVDDRRVCIPRLVRFINYQAT